MIHLTPGRLRNDSALEKIFNAIPPLPSPRLRNSLRSNTLRRSIASTSLKGRLTVWIKVLFRRHEDIIIHFSSCIP